MRTVRYAGGLPLIFFPDPGDPPLLDVCFPEALTYLLEIHTHYGASLWAHVGWDIDRADLRDWVEINVYPSVVGLSGDCEYWRQISTQPRITVTISHADSPLGPLGPSGLWIALKPQPSNTL